MDNRLFRPTGKTCRVWQYFGFIKGEKEDKNCKISKLGVTYAVVWTSKEAYHTVCICTCT